MRNVMKKTTLLVLAVSLLAACVGPATPTASPSPIPSPTPTPGLVITTPAGATIIRQGFNTDELTEEERAFLEEIEEGYLKAAEKEGLELTEITIVETHGSQEGDVGAYLIQGEETFWVLYWVLSPRGGTLKRVPEHEGQKPLWDADYNRFVYLDEGGEAITTYCPAIEEIIPVVEGLACEGFSPEQLDYVRESLEWLKEVAPERWAFIQAQRIPRVVFHSRGRPLAAATASGVSVVFDAEGLRLPGFPLEAQKVWFLSVLYHEAVHVGQFRVNKTCGLEDEAYAEQNELLHELHQVVSPGTQEYVQYIIDHGEEYLEDHISYCP